MLLSASLIASAPLTASGLVIPVFAIAAAGVWGVRRSRRLAGLLVALGGWAVWQGLQGASPAAALLQPAAWLWGLGALIALSGQPLGRTSLTLVLLYWLGGVASRWPLPGGSETLHLGVRLFHQVIAFAASGFALAAFVVRATAADEQAADEQAAGSPAAPAMTRPGWTTLTRVVAACVIGLLFALVYEMAVRSEPLGLAPPLGLVASLGEAVAAICLWRGLGQAASLEGSGGSSSRPAGWLTRAGWLAVMALTGLTLGIVAAMAGR